MGGAVPKTFELLSVSLSYTRVALQRFKGIYVLQIKMHSQICTEWRAAEMLMSSGRCLGATDDLYLPEVVEGMIHDLLLVSSVNTSLHFNDF